MSTVSSTPNLPSPTPQSNTNTASVKAATPEIILFNDESTPIEIMKDLVFENIGGQELINI